MNPARVNQTNLTNQVPQSPKNQNNPVPYRPGKVPVPLPPKPNVQPTPKVQPSAPLVPAVRGKPDYSKPYQEAKPAAESLVNQKIPYLEQQNLKEILLDIGRIILTTQIYKIDHPIVKKKVDKLSEDVIKIANASGRLILATRDDVIFLNGYQERVSGGPLETLVDTLKFLKVASFEFEKGITTQEISSLFKIINAQKRVKVAGNIKEMLRAENISHIRPIFLQYIEVSDTPKDIPRPKNVVVPEGALRKKGYPSQEQQIVDLLRGKSAELPKKMNTFLMGHPKLAAVVMVKLLDELEQQNMDSFAAFQQYVQSMSHYMARMSRLEKNPDTVAKTLEKLEKHLVVRLKSLHKDRRFISEVKRQIKDALSLVQVEQTLAHYSRAKKNLEDTESEIIDTFEKKKVPAVKELKDRLKELGLFQSKLQAYLQ